MRRPVQVLDASTKAVDLIMRFMPLKSDRALPGDLLRSMRECGWVSMPHVPRVFRPTLLPPPGSSPQPHAPPAEALLSSDKYRHSIESLRASSVSKQRHGDKDWEISQIMQQGQESL